MRSAARSDLQTQPRNSPARRSQTVRFLLRVRPMFGRVDIVDVSADVDDVEFGHRARGDYAQDRQSAVDRVRRVGPRFRPRPPPRRPGAFRLLRLPAFNVELCQSVEVVVAECRNAHPSPASARTERARNREIASSLLSVRWSPPARCASRPVCFLRGTGS